MDGKKIPEKIIPCLRVGAYAGECITFLSSGPKKWIWEGLDIFSDLALSNSSYQMDYQELSEAIVFSASPQIFKLQAALSDL